MFAKILDTSDFPARWQCGDWTQAHGWTHIISDCAIFGAYAAIPMALIYFIKKRGDMPFPAILWLFAAFILSCGIGHLIEATIFWNPWYRLSGLMKAITALVSWATVIALLPVIPKALHLPGLAKINADLEREVKDRKRTEAELEERVKELAEANERMHRFHEATLGREERMMELKREVNALMEELQRAPKYDVKPA